MGFNKQMVDLTEECGSYAHLLGIDMSILGIPWFILIY